ncbi:hypothetical protein THTE_3095 [Thermogutta terrifontis]|uniref:Uncharacterized protein n=1 Tax=Thermogutta terrifontis TaxID=1331910 RepID=A0A286RIB2_9BACT|nr:hypothetical protein THTE_3095 [Thermogutta terrifontis]
MDDCGETEPPALITEDRGKSLVVFMDRVSTKGQLSRLSPGQIYHLSEA